MKTMHTLYERAPAPANTLPPELAAAYGGGLVVPDGQPGERPMCCVNFIESLDGVISYTQPGEPYQGTVGGKSDIDHMVMGILRARADAVIFGAGSLRMTRGTSTRPRSSIRRMPRLRGAALVLGKGRPCRSAW